MEQGKNSDKVSLMLNVLDLEAGMGTPFGKNTLGDNAYRRAERIAAAVHLLTDHISETEPLRMEVRRVATNLLNSVLELRRGFRSSGGEALSSVQAEVTHIVSLVRLLTVVGIVSAANAEVLIAGLSDLSSVFETQRAHMSEDVSLSREGLMPKPRIIQHSRQHNPEKRTAVKDIFEIKDNTSISDKKQTRDNVSFSKSKGLIMFLKQGGSYGIKDISIHMPEYSEKTIQRMLAELVSGGVVKKEGDKRWSKYALIEGASI